MPKQSDMHKKTLNIRINHPNINKVFVVVVLYRNKSEKVQKKLFENLKTVWKLKNLTVWPILKRTV